MNILKPTIGLEIHVQLNTRSKLFCSCSTASFGTAANTNICPVCTGDPGVLPVLNSAALELIVRMGLAMGCRIRERSVFSRKNYFYPDLPKNYQISQYDQPVAHGGSLAYFSGGEKKRVRIHRIHLEEDAGKLLHSIGSEELSYSLVDFNRAGIPLAETVTEPDFTSPAEAGDFLAALRATLRALGVSHCDMEKGELRADVNVSVSAQPDKMGVKVEVKNLNSFKAARDALEYEIVRQSGALDRGEQIRQETRLWNVKAGRTEIMRSKEEASDYRYFPEPDLGPAIAEKSWQEAIKRSIPELPMERSSRYQADSGLSLKEAQALVFHEDPGVAVLFDATLAAYSGNRGSGRAKAAANWILNDLLGLLKLRDAGVQGSEITGDRLASFLSVVEEKGLTSRLAKDLLARLVENPSESADQALFNSGVVLVSGDEDLLVFVRKAIEENPRAVAEFKGGKDKAVQSLIGSVMRQTKGQAHPQKVQDLLRRELSL